MSNQSYLRNPLIHRNRRKSLAATEWVRSFDCADMSPLIICRGPIRMETMSVFEELGITRYGILISEKDSIMYPQALSPELRKGIAPARVHRVQDYSGATREERLVRIRQIINIAKQNSYDSIFAGYGFMAEDEDMVALMESAGLNFIGPCSKTIKGAGRKDLAKRTALTVDVSVTPGVDNATILTVLNAHPNQENLLLLNQQHDLGLSQSSLRSLEVAELQAEALLEAAFEKGVDLFSIDELATTLTGQVRSMFETDPDCRIRLKAVGGGGGKGQRILDCPQQFDGSARSKLDQAAAPTAAMLREVLAEVKATGTGDNKNVLAEINCESIRHEEIQVVGNGHWCITMGGRDCSVQMNEQKLLELSVTVEDLEQAIAEAEANNQPEAHEALLSDLDILRDLEDEAARFGRAVGLDSVSTFECILDRGKHYFMEMNTRVQVEHRVTELCYCLHFANPIDANDFFIVDSIVELMVLLSRHGARLPLPTRVRRENVALEVRLNATDDALKPHAGGTISHWSDGLESEIRDDQGICLRNPDTDVFMKYQLAGAYDSNIALLLTTGESRYEAFARMAEILRQTKLSGEDLNTNLNFHYGLVNWFIGNGVLARPTTNFVSAYLTAVGRLKKLASQLDIVQAYEQMGKSRLGLSEDEKYTAAVGAIMQQKSSLLARALNQILAQPHFLAGWLARNRQHFKINENGIRWLTNPVVVLADLYHYLNMDSQNKIPALYRIWDHDQKLLEDSEAFYQRLDERLNCENWQEFKEALAGPGGKKCLGEQIEEIRAAHEGFQLGMEILSILPYIGYTSGFFDLRVNPDLTIEIPDCLLAADNYRDSIRHLSPPPVAAADEITTQSGGMFYARESPDRDAFVTAGQHFDEGDPLFIVEVMKMFNTVRAPFAGTIDEILIGEDATIVKKGQVIFKVTPDVSIEVQSGEDTAIFDETSAFLDFVDL